MKRFTQLFQDLDETNSTTRKVAAMVSYFRDAPPEDAIWAIYFLSGRRPKRLVSYKSMRTWAAQSADLRDLDGNPVDEMPEWLFEACYAEVGDLAETIALLISGNENPSEKPLHWWIEERLFPLREMDDQQQRETVTSIWKQLSTRERFVWNKLITSAMRVGVGKKLLVRALSEFCGVEESVIMHRLMGPWTPSRGFYEQLLSHDTTDTDISRPYPFCLAHPLEGDPSSLGPPEKWLAEWKVDGIRAQIVRRQGEVFIWSRGEELITDQYPEVRDAALVSLPDGSVLDGELFAFHNNVVLPFGQMQRRIGRKSPGKKILAEVPVVFTAFDLLEEDNNDIRKKPMRQRRRRLEMLVGPNNKTGGIIRISPLIKGSWEDLAGLRAESRKRKMEGMMLKRADAPYVGGRRTGIWWKWKIDPMTLDAVLMYAQPGSGRRASLYTDYTFGLWDDGELKPFAKGYFGLTDDEFESITRWVRRNTLNTFGPVREVEPELVFEIAFEGVRRNKRKKIGMSVRFPRMVRWRKDLNAGNADTVEQLARLLPNLPPNLESA